MQTAIPLGDIRLSSEVASLIREARALVGWSQRELAERASTSQSMVSRLERQAATEPDVLVLGRIFSALGLRVGLSASGRHLDDRRRQRDLVHAAMTGSIARRLHRAGWQVATEVPVGDAPPRGWIDLLAFRASDEAILVEESKGDLVDAGDLLRQVAFYEREAWLCARRLGWHARRTVVLVAGLDSAALAARVASNRDLLLTRFRGPVRDIEAWLRSDREPPPTGWSLALVDPANRGRLWLRPSPLVRRQRPHAYRDYADAASRLRRGSQHRVRR